MFGVNFFTENSRKVFNFESFRRDLVLFPINFIVSNQQLQSPRFVSNQQQLLINFMDENAYLHVYVVPKRHS